MYKPPNIDRNDWRNKADSERRNRDIDIDIEITRVLHLSHSGDIAMVTQARNKIFWPGMKRDLKKIYDECPTCQENKPSKASEHNEISQDDIFENRAS